ncbi:MAG: hypothetical protein K2X32_13825, partial [Phycisphaerales bacterium]|nr:hypothetical protein [Phycisphaerales bacterium]
AGSSAWLVLLAAPAIDRGQRAGAGPEASTNGATSDAWLRAFGRGITGPPGTVTSSVLTALASAVPDAATGRLGVRSVALTSLRSDADAQRVAWTMAVTSDRAIADDVFVTTPPAGSSVVRVTRPASDAVATGPTVIIERAADAGAMTMTSPVWGPSPDVWAAHDAALARVKPAIVGQRVLDLRVDISGLRRSAPELFFAPGSVESAEGAPGQPHAILRALGLANGRSVGVRATMVEATDVKLADARGVNEIARPGGYAGPALLRLDLTHASRADALEHATSMSVATGFYPAELSALPPSTAAWAMVVRTDLGGPGVSEFGAGPVGWSRWLSGVWLATHSAGERADALRRLSAWQLAGAAPLRTVAQAMGRWTVAWPLADAEPRGVDATVGRAMVVCCPLRSPVNLADVRAAIGKLGESIGAEAIPLTSDDRLFAAWTFRRDAGADGTRVAVSATVAIARLDGIEGGAIVGVVRVGDSGGGVDDASALRSQAASVRAAANAAPSR